MRSTFQASSETNSRTLRQLGWTFGPFLLRKRGCVAANLEPRWVSSLEVRPGVHFRVGRIDSDYVVEWSESVRVRISATGDVVEVNTVDGVDARLLGKILDCSIPAMASHLSGGLAFHASAVVFAARAFVFLGASGQGKSTLASALCLRSGGKLLADDITHCAFESGTWIARGREGQTWLMPPSRNALLGKDGGVAGKEPLSLAQESEAPLAALVLLEEAPETSLSRLTGLRAAEVLLTQLIRLDLEDPAVHLRDLKHIESLLRAIPIFVLRRPLRFDALSDVLAVVFEMAMRQQ